MTADGLARTVRGQLGLGRMLPLGRPADGVWIVERAAARVLREAEHAVPGVRLGTLRIALAEPDSHDWGAVRTANPAAPPSALPAGPLRITADFAADLAACGGRPLPQTAGLLRGALAGTADRRLGLAVTEIDLRVADLLAPEPHPAETVVVTEVGASGTVVVAEVDAGEDAPPDDFPLPPAPGASLEPAVPVTAAVPGVAALTSRLTGPAGGSPEAVLVQIAVDGGHRALDVALAVRAAVTAAATAAARGPVATAVVVTDIV